MTQKGSYNDQLAVPGPAGDAGEKIIRMHLSDFLLEHCANSPQATVRDRLLTAAQCLADARTNKSPGSRARGEGTVGDLIGEPTNPLRFVDPPGELLGCWRGVGRAPIETVYARLAELGVRIPADGFLSLSPRARRALLLSGINRGSVTRAAVMAIHDRFGDEGLRSALARKGAATPIEEILRWLGKPAVNGEREFIKGRIERLRRELSEAEARLAKMEQGVDERTA